MSETGRVEAFSDGVFAVAITLLILEIKVPKGEGENLLHAIGHEWPSFMAYVVSFLVIGIIWANHHTVFSRLAKVDRGLIFLNLLLLLVVVAIPWPTALVAEYLREDNKGANVAVAVYGGFMVLHALTFTLFWWYATKTGHLFDDKVDRAAVKAGRWRFGLGTLLYPVTVGLAFVSPVLTLALHGALAVYYAFNQVPIPDVEDQAS